MEILQSVGNVLIIGLILGAGLPALFAVGMRLHAEGSDESTPDGSVVSGNAALRYAAYAIFGFVALVIVVGLLWITRHTIYYYLDIKLFPFGYK